MTYMLSVAAGLLMLMAAIGCGKASDGARPSAVAAGGGGGGGQTQSLVALHGGKLRGDEDDDDENTPARGDKIDSDGDFDNDAKAPQAVAYRDRDDEALTAWGHPVSTRDRRLVTDLLKRYYKAAAASDGKTACGMIYAVLIKAIPEDYGQPPGPPALRGKTCSVVMTKLFAQRHRQLLVESKTMNVTDVRVLGEKGRAFVGFASEPASYIVLHRSKADRWTVAGTILVRLA